MRLHYLKIDHFKNLNEFEIDFLATSDESVTLLLGQNGSGKSNLFEALVIIYRDLLTGKRTDDFGYEVRYSLRGGAIVVKVCNPPSSSAGVVGRSSPFVTKEGETINEFAFTVVENGQQRAVSRREIRQYLPRYVVTYYSGVSNRLEHHFFQPQLEFRDELLAGEGIPLRPRENSPFAEGSDYALTTAVERASLGRINALPVQVPHSARHQSGRRLLPASYPRSTA